MNAPSKETTQVGPDVHVTIRYSIFEEGPGAAAEACAEDLTDTYVHGYGQVFTALEKGLEGQVSGAHVSLVADPDDAFGPHEQDGVIEVDKEGLEGSEDLQVGEEVMASGPEGDILMRVIEVRPDSLLVDTNHPLAGKRVRFEVDVVALRPATEEEIAEAQEDLDGDGPCGCGHDHAHEPHEHEHEGAENLVTLTSKKKVVS
ncbi:MAG: peptidylprolyl isomerase [Polyangiaceae bacterium]|nr:peptidylprolyl isomerase [Polyangiaceae bacterium]